jgi:Flp pilus assembly protein TadB
MEPRPVTANVVGALAAAAAALALGMLPLVGSWTPKPARHPDADALADAGWGLGLARWEGIRATLVVVGVTVAHAVGMAPLAGAALALAPSIAVRLRARIARDRARASIAEVLVTAHAMLRSGIALPEALRRAADACDDRIARRPFEIAIRRFDLGAALDDAIRSAVASSTDRRLGETFHTLALGVTERLPIERAASLLEALAERAVHDERLDEEIRARTAGLRVQIYLLAGIVPAIALYLVATMPGLGATLSTTLGRTVLIPVAIALEVAGVVVSRRVVRGVAR